MILFSELQVGSKDGSKHIRFGQANTDDELVDIYKLRYSMYSKKEYIDSSTCHNNMEIDEYDIEKKCFYFIAKLNDKLIGSIRVIVDDPLPTEKSFSFEEPEAIKLIPRSNRGELGRFIIIPPNKENNEYLPRGLIMLFLVDCLSSFGLEHNFLGGYSFVKRSLEIKIQKMKMPIGIISSYKQIYPETGVLYKYFTQPLDPVIPVYYLTKDFYNFSQKRIRNSLMFKELNPNSFVLRNNLYTKFLRALKII